MAARHTSRAEGKIPAGLQSPCSDGVVWLGGVGAA
eukprot:CAMPEP_0181423854 /NCGR_PEP_ID=MMETSP1110-20121109/14342_1 /TAXON_ID=174948 /ORGANISM="Symbiodinium sp., Strain CCMP421" /LENGTH=34 /DNA_ID= /DNA_START= /DNA_END= /DNA_ORIENTATION=